MSLHVAVASTQYLVDTTAPITAYPFSVGFWLRINTGSSYKHVWGIYSSSNTQKFCFFIDNGATNMSLIMQVQGGVDAQAVVPATIVINNWYYVLGRFISATNRRVDVLFPNGSISRVQNVTSNTPTLVTPREGFGADLSSGVANTFHDGMIAEHWKTDNDIQADGAQTQDWLLRQLARNGPFSVPYIKKNIVEYHSFRDVTNFCQEDDIYYSAGRGMQAIVNTGGAKNGPHPPLSCEYPRPGDGSLQLII